MIAKSEALYGAWMLVLLAFAELSFVPAPSDVLLIGCAWASQLLVSCSLLFAVVKRF